MSLPEQFYLAYHCSALNAGSVRSHVKRESFTFKIEIAPRRTERNKLFLNPENMTSRITRRNSTQSQQEQEEDDDIIEIMDVAPPEKLEEERKYARQKESILNDEMKFMENFDPDNSRRRLKRSRRRHYHPDGRPMVVADDFEICDCLEPKCRGCHKPCKNCKDKRCGLECRVNRRWIYETVDIEGRNKTLRHPHMYGEPY